MLLVKITGYIVPVAEQPQASLTPVISVANQADEGAVITGLIRIYRESTGLMIYSSELAVTQLEHHSTTNIAALTPFDPPAPADDDYFVKADITATSYLPGPPTHDSLGAWHFDIKTPAMGEAPAGHGVTHELGGSDELDVTGLTGAGGVANPATFELFTANGTWTKPAGAKLVYVECVAAGGGGGGARGDVYANSGYGGGGGGGGAMARKFIPADALGATETVTIGAGGPGGTGGTIGDGTTGTVGGNTSFGAHLTSFGGGPGAGGMAASDQGDGGGGGGTGSAGATLTGGFPGSSTFRAVGGSGAAGDPCGGTANGGFAEFGGGGGGGGQSNGGTKGGGSLYGAAGGGGGGQHVGGNGEGNGGTGGKYGEYASGGGAAVHANGADGDGYHTNGGGGGGGTYSPNLSGGNGGNPGGGGGGGEAYYNTGGDGGNGGRGEVRVWVWF